MKREKAVEIIDSIGVESDHVGGRVIVKGKRVPKREVEAVRCGIAAGLSIASIVIGKKVDYDPTKNAVSAFSAGIANYIDEFYGGDEQ